MILGVLRVLRVLIGLSVLVVRVNVKVDEGVGRVEEDCAEGPTIVARAEEIRIGAPTSVEGPGADSVMRPISKVKDNTWKPPVFAQNSALWDMPSFVMV